MKLFHENAIFLMSESKVIISLFETVRLSVSISSRNLYNSLKSIKESYRQYFFFVSALIYEVMAIIQSFLETFSRYL